MRHHGVARLQNPHNLLYNRVCETGVVVSDNLTVLLVEEYFGCVTSKRINWG